MSFLTNCEGINIYIVASIDLLPHVFRRMRSSTLQRTRTTTQPDNYQTYSLICIKHTCEVVNLRQRHDKCLNRDHRIQARLRPQETNIRRNDTSFLDLTARSKFNASLTKFQSNLLLTMNWVWCGQGVVLKISWVRNMCNFLFLGLIARSNTIRKLYDNNNRGGCCTDVLHQNISE